MRILLLLLVRIFVRRVANKTEIRQGIEMRHRTNYKQCVVKKAGIRKINKVSKKEGEIVQESIGQQK